MVELPVWGWVVGVIGVIAAGIGLGYLIIFLFWKIERYFNPPAPPPVIKEVPVEEPPVPCEPEEPVAQEEEPPVEVVEEVTEEEIAPVMLASMSDEEKRFVKFTMVLHARFNHPFKGLRTIACWDIGLEDGDISRDTEGNELTFRVIGSAGEEKPPRYYLVDESGTTTISVVAGKKYLKQQANLDVDKIKLPG